MPSPAKVQRVLEINLISAQGLKPPPSPRRKLQTYALTWVDSSTKLRTRVDKIGGENPTWNDKFLFRVTPEFLASETSGVSVAIYAIGTFRDHLIGTVRFLTSNILSSGSDSDVNGTRAPCFSAFQIRRPSGRFHGVMNIGAMVIDGSEFPALNKISAIGYRDLMGKTKFPKKAEDEVSKWRNQEPKLKNGDESCENSCTDSVSLSDGGESSSTASSSSSPRTTALKDSNGVRELVENKGLNASGFLCCMVAQRTIHLNPGDPNTNSETRDVER